MERNGKRNRDWIAGIVTRFCDQPGNSMSPTASRSRWSPRRGSVTPPRYFSPTVTIRRERLDRCGVLILLEDFAMPRGRSRAAELERPKPVREGSPRTWSLGQLVLIVQKKTDEDDDSPNPGRENADGDMNEDRNGRGPTRSGRDRGAVERDRVRAGWLENRSCRARVVGAPATVELSASVGERYVIGTDRQATLTIVDF